MSIFLQPVTGNPAARVAIATVLLLIALDVVVGFTGAAITKTISSSKMRSGLLHKLMELAAVALADIVDGALLGGFDIMEGSPLLIGVCAYIALMEVSSVLELIGKYNPDMTGGGILSLFDHTEKER